MIFIKIKSIKNENDSKTLETLHKMESLYQKFVGELLKECPDLKNIVDRITVQVKQKEKNPKEIVSSLLHHYIAIKGHVQSGKTKFILCVSFLMLWFDISPVLVLRNLHSDVSQIITRLDEMRSKYKSFLPKIKIIKSNTKSETKQTKSAFYICLGNGIAMKKFNKIVPDHYVCILDEVDSLDMGRDTHRNEQISLLKKNALIVFGVSATMLDPLAKEQVLSEDVILLKTASDYKGIKDIKFVPITDDSVFSNRVDDDLTEKQPGLLTFLDDFSKRTVISQNEKLYPHIVLVNVGSTVSPYIKFQKLLQDELPSLCTILYNANGITVFLKGTMYSRRDTISQTLQWIKDNWGAESVPTIAIFSCVLAGRGVSFVSEYYEWHLNTMYLCVSPTCDEAELLQKIRLSGRYQDSIPLELYTLPATYADILKAFYKQEEIVLKTTSSDGIISEQMADMTLHKEKFSKRRVLKDGIFPVKKGNATEDEWSSSVYHGTEFAPSALYEAYGEQLPQPGETCHLGDQLNVIVEEDEETDGNELDEMRRLERKMIPSWSKRIGESKIATWMDELDPERIYSRSDMIEMCKKHEIPLQHLVVAKYEKSGSRGYGKILYIRQGMYQLQPYLIDAHKKYFS